MKSYISIKTTYSKRIILVHLFLKLTIIVFASCKKSNYKFLVRLILFCTAHSIKTIPHIIIYNNLDNCNDFSNRITAIQQYIQFHTWKNEHGKCHKNMNRFVKSLLYETKQTILDLLIYLICSFKICII